MPYPQGARLALRSLQFSFLRPFATTTRWQLRCASFATDSKYELLKKGDEALFSYTSGRWLYNEALRLAERRRVFNAGGLCRLAAQSVHRTLHDVAYLLKQTEDGDNRTFLIGFHDGFELMACIPLPMMIPRHLALASEVATMAMLRSSGLPVPEVYGYSPTEDNEAETEYIFMEHIQGTPLIEKWDNLEEEDIISVMRQVAQLESIMMSIIFPAGGSLYYTKDLEKLTGWPGIPLDDMRFCIGPSTRSGMWLGKRTELNIDRGPYTDAEAALVGPAKKELTYLKRFGQPLLPYHRLKREGYQFQAQSPSDHIENIRRYLLIAPSLVPRDHAFSRFGMRHLDLGLASILVSRSPDSELNIVGLLDWYNASVLPIFLLAGVPDRFQNYDGPVSNPPELPSLPENFDALEEEKKSDEKDLYRRRLLHHHYVNSSAEHNHYVYETSTDPMCILRNRLFTHAGSPWEGEPVYLKLALMDAAENWEALTGGGTPCPLVFDPKDVLETRKLNDVLTQSCETLKLLEELVGSGPEGTVYTWRYEESMARARYLKENALKMAETDADRENMASIWPFDDMDEGMYS